MLSNAVTAWPQVMPCRCLRLPYTLRPRPQALPDHAAPLGTGGSAAAAKGARPAAKKVRWARNQGQLVQEGAVGSHPVRTYAVHRPGQSCECNCPHLFSNWNATRAGALMPAVMQHGGTASALAH